MVLLWFNLFCLGLNWKIIRLVFLTLTDNLFGQVLNEFQCCNAHVVVELLWGSHPTPVLCEGGA